MGTLQRYLWRGRDLSSAVAPQGVLQRWWPFRAVRSEVAFPGFPLRDSAMPRGTLPDAVAPPGDTFRGPLRAAAPGPLARGGSIPRDPPRDDSRDQEHSRGCGGRGPFQAVTPQGSTKDGEAPSEGRPGVSSIPRFPPRDSAMPEDSPRCGGAPRDTFGVSDASGTLRGEVVHTRGPPGWRQHPRGPSRDDGATEEHSQSCCGAGQGPFMAVTPQVLQRWWPAGGRPRSDDGIPRFPLGTVYAPRDSPRSQWRPRDTFRVSDALRGPSRESGGVPQMPSLRGGGVPWTIVGAAASPERTLQRDDGLRPGTLPGLWRGQEPFMAVAPQGPCKDGGPSRAVPEVSGIPRFPLRDSAMPRDSPRCGSAPRTPSGVIDALTDPPGKVLNSAKTTTPKGPAGLVFQRRPSKAAAPHMDHCRGGSIPRDPQGATAQPEHPRRLWRGAGTHGDAPGVTKMVAPSRAVPGWWHSPGSHLGDSAMPEGLSQMRWRPQRHLQGSAMPSGTLRRNGAPGVLQGCKNYYTQGPYRSGVPKGPPRGGGAPMDHCRGGSIPRDPPRDDSTTRNTPRGCGAGQGPFMSGDAPRGPAKDGGPSRAVPGVVAFPGSHLGTVLCPEGLSQMRWRPQRHLQGQRCPQGPSRESGAHQGSSQGWWCPQGPFQGHWFL
ncbi:collagen alpha-1(I) chain-like [Homarus americanus]|uniref:collagen alpha-1(I) chain-like n=1 Tax=Homarus americanus TaxID=6706 RepID=UPI001C46D906|nr:collagen alpha-1(I) chain-like [Homarus americanus]